MTVVVDFMQEFRQIVVWRVNRPGLLVYKAHGRVGASGTIPPNLRSTKHTMRAVYQGAVLRETCTRQVHSWLVHLTSQ